MKWKTLKAEEPPCGRINLTMTYCTSSGIYRGLLCMVEAVLNYDTGLWDANLEIAHPIIEPIPDGVEIETDLFWKDFAEPFATKEEALAASFELAKEIVDGKQAGLNDFLISHRTDEVTDIWPPERPRVLQGPNGLLVVEEASSVASKELGCH